MKFILLHGWDGTPDKDWFPWLKSELEHLGHEVIIPLLPHTEEPLLIEWLGTLNNLLDSEKLPVTLVGHSLGGVLILHYLQQQKATIPIAAAIFVASWGEDDGHLESELVNFFVTPFDFAKIRSRAKQFISISSTNDPFINKQESTYLAEHLGIKPLWVENGGHFTSKSGFNQFPFLLDTIKQVLK